jgi:hypothetical protein
MSTPVNFFCSNWNTERATLAGSIIQQHLELLSPPLGTRKSRTIGYKEGEQGWYIKQIFME